MKWLMETIRTPIGKKLLMAATGLAFVLFLLVHLLGNLLLYKGPEAFDAYAARLHSLGVIVAVAETGLLIFAVVHIITGLLLFFENFKARPVRYAVKKTAGGRTIGSATMPYTGLLILGFVILHLINFRFPAKAPESVYASVAALFGAWPYMLIYSAAVIVVAIHIRHGFWSLFQTAGLNHEKYMPFILGVGIALSLLFAFGFGLIPVYMGLF
ncbi:MAG: succinate dehydrogenase [Desulfobacteraceae bacterium]|jgi:succinate dehydrogenase / fumarate reductase cytochrome b subunit|nr:MAG: succinate dehydrogenase [Desulfobacteraceae bacterium]